MRTLPNLIYKLLCEKIKDHSLAEEDSMNFQCEWRPLKILFGFACNIMDEQCISHSVSGYANRSCDNSFSLVLAEVEEILRKAHEERVAGLATAFISSILCAAPDDILANLPSVLAIIHLHFPSDLPFLSSFFFQEQKLLVRIMEICPKLFFSGLEIINQEVNHSYTPILPVTCDSMEFSASAFGSFLKHSTFYALFSAVLSFATWESPLTRIEEVFPSNIIIKLLQVKIMEGSVDESILRLKYVLFWTYHMFIMCKKKQSFIFCELLQLCIALVQDIMDHLLKVIFNQASLNASGLSSAGQYAQLITELTFSHPIVILYVSNPLSFTREFTDVSCERSVDFFLSTLRQSIHPMDHITMQLLSKFCNFLSVVISSLSSSGTHNSVCQSLFRVQNNLVQKILLSFREKFEQFVVSKNPGPFLPIFYIFQSLMEFTSPFDLLELVHWMFSKIDGVISDGTSSLVSAVSVGLHIADCSLEMLYSLLQESTLGFKSHFSLVGRIKSFDASLIPKIIYKILDFALHFSLKQGDTCLLKFVNSIYNHQFVKPSTALLPLHVLLSNVIFNIPLKMLVYCIHSTSKIKAKTLLLLTEVSPVHMNFFGKMFLAVLDINLSTVHSSDAGDMCLSNCKMTNLKECFLNDDILLLLPVALSLFSSTLAKHGNQGIQPLLKIPCIYAGILLEGFSNWDTFVSHEIFQQDNDDFLPGTLEEFNKFYYNSLIRNAVDMLNYFFVLNGSSVRWKKRLKLFDSICTQSSFFDGQFSVGAEGMDACSYKESLKLVNQVAAKISLMRILLFTSDCPIQFMAISEEDCVKNMITEKESGRLNCAKLKFMNILLNTLEEIFKQFPLKVDSSVASCATHCYHVFRFLEHLILKELVWLTKEMHSILVKISSFTLMNHFIKSSLLHRFEDPVTLKVIRCILIALSGSKFSFNDVLELVIGHSAIVKVISWNLAISDSSIFASSGTFLQPLNSILKLVNVFCSLQNVRQNVSCKPSSKVGCDDSSSEDTKLELVRLLRILFHQQDKNPRMKCFNSKELLSLLLSGYTATQSQIDREIFHLMHEIESREGPDNGSIEALDYIWGVTALKMRTEKSDDVLLPLNRTSDCETIEERKILFRENIPIDSKLCAVTVLHLCNNRSSSDSEVSMESILKDTSINCPKIMESIGKDSIQPYDPLFILRFSIHSLSMGYLEPVEFSRLGLLAVTFASISSSDENIRKLGYECLGRFNFSLESFRKSKDLLQLQLLLVWLQNGITEECQKIPSVIAIFAAEASLTLLDHSQNFFLTISKFLMHSPSVNLKAIPLFQTLLGGNSIHFKTDSLWILRLLFTGLNSPDDAKLYLRNNILDVVLTYSASSLADDEFKILTLMIVKKCMQLHILASHLVKEFGLLPWLSSLLLFYGDRLTGHSTLEVMKLILQVVTDVISSTMISEWLQDCALEQLSEFSVVLLKLFVGAVKFLKEDVSLVNEILIVITSTVKLSQKRKIYQPHFRLSLECLYQLFQAVSAEFGSSGHTVELGVYAILINTPTPVISYVHKARLWKLLAWTVPAALWSNSTKKSLIKNLNSSLLIPSEEDQEESLPSKLLRWVSTSIILGSVLSNDNKIYLSSISGNDMFSFIKGISVAAYELLKYNSILNESLAVLILHLQNFFGSKCVQLEVVSALCVLLLGTDSRGTVKEYLDDNCEAIQSLCSKIRFPAEANPSWRWSFDKPSNEPPSNKSETELMEEEHACQSLLIIFSRAVAKSHGFQSLSLEDTENHRLFQ